MKKKLTQGEIGLKYKNALAPVLKKYDEMEVIRITKDYHLLSDGTIFEETDLTFRYNGKWPLEKFPWHIPFISSESRVIGVRVRPNIKVTGFTSSRQQSFHLIEIALTRLEPGEHIHLQFEYFNCGAASFERKIFENTIHFPMAFLPANTVSSLDIRLHIPFNAEYEADINLAKFIEVDRTGEKLLLTSQEQNMVGDVSGNITLKYKNSIYGAFVSMAAGFVFSAALLVLPDFKPMIGNLWYPVVFALTSLGLFASYKAIQRK